MNEPQFIPSGTPHSVEVAEGSHVAMSKSAHTGADVRQTLGDHFAQGHEIEVDANRIVLTANAAASDNTVKVPRGDAIERASKTFAAGGPSERALKGVQLGSLQGGRRSAGSGDGKATVRERPMYDMEMPEMNFPARMIQLRIENDAVRAQLEDLQTMLGNATNDSQ